MIKLYYFFNFKTRFFIMNLNSKIDESFKQIQSFSPTTFAKSLTSNMADNFGKHHKQIVYE